MDRPGLAPQRGYVFQRRLLVGRVLAHRVDQFRNQVVASFQLYLDIAPPGQRALPVAYEAVVNHDGVNQQRDEQAKEDPLGHGFLLRPLTGLREARSAQSNASRAQCSVACGSSKNASGAR